MLKQGFWPQGTELVVPSKLIYLDWNKENKYFATMLLGVVPPSRAVERIEMAPEKIAMWPPSHNSHASYKSLFGG